jgi:hypothetical protein
LWVPHGANIAIIACGDHAPWCSSPSSRAITSERPYAVMKTMMLGDG